MLSKLLKHEFRATGRIMLPLLGVELLLSVLAGLSVRGLDRIGDMNFLGVTYVTTLIVFFLGLFAVGVVAVVLMIQRFYRNLLRDEGYLSMTLPVTVDAHIWAKLIVSFVWFLAVAVLTILAMAVMVAIGSQLRFLSGFPEWSEVREFLRMAIGEFGGANLALLPLEALLISFFGTCAMCLRCYSALAIGGSAADHKLAWSFLAYIVIGIVLSLIENGIGIGLVNTDYFFMQDFASAQDSIRFFHTVMWLSILSSAIYSAIFYFVTRFFLKNKLNLA